MRKAIAKGKSNAVYAFSYNTPAKVIAVTIDMLRDLMYDVEASKFYNDVVYISIPAIPEE